MERSNKLILNVEWHGSPDPKNGTGRVRSQIIGGMQIEFWKRDELQTTYGFPQRWEYRLVGLKGDICWGLGYTKTEIKRVALEALQKRLQGL